LGEINFKKQSFKDAEADRFRKREMTEKLGYSKICSEYKYWRGICL
jgi:hypothetical protein